MANKVKKSSGQVMEIGTNNHTAAVSKKRKSALLTTPNDTIFLSYRQRNIP